MISIKYILIINFNFIIFSLDVCIYIYYNYLKLILIQKTIVDWLNALKFYGLFMPNRKLSWKCTKKNLVNY